MGISAVVAAVISLGASAYQGRQARKKAKRAREAALGQQVRPSNSASPVPIHYGYISTPGIRVWTETGPTFNTTTYPGNLPRLGKLSNPNNEGAKNEYLCAQHVIGAGEISGVSEMWSDQLKPDTEYINGSSWGDWKFGEASSAAGHFNSARNNAKFTGLSYATTVHKLNREDPQYGGAPEVTFFIKGNKINTLSMAGNVVSLSANKTFSNNVSEVLLDYLTSTSYGLGWSLTDDIDLDSFYRAKVIADQVMQAQGTTANQIPSSVEFNATDKFPYNYFSESRNAWREAGDGDTYLEAYQSFGLVGNTGSRPGWQDRRSVYQASDLSSDMKRYEFNGVLSTDNTHRDNISSILQVVPGYSFFRSPTGKWKLVFPDSVTDEATQSVAVIDDSDLVRNISIEYPDSNERLNQLDIKFSNRNKEFADDSVSYPAVSTDTKSLYFQLQQLDQNKLLSEVIDLSGIVDEYHANAWASNTIFISRRPTYSFETRPKGFLYEPGDIIKLEDTAAGVDAFVKIIDTRVLANLNIQFTAVFFDKADYGWLPLKFDVVTSRGELDPSIGTPINVVSSFDPATRIVTAKWAPSLTEDVSVNSYVAQVQRDTDEWITVGSTIRTSREVQYNPGDSGVVLKFRVLSRTIDNRYSPNSAESAPITIPNAAAGFLINARFRRQVIPVTPSGVFVDPDAVLEVYNGAQKVDLLDRSAPLTDNTWKIKTTAITETGGVTDFGLRTVVVSSADDTATYSLQNFVSNGTLSATITYKGPDGEEADFVVDTSIIQGARGEDGQGKEFIFATSTSDASPPTAPSNSWGFDAPVSPWFDAAPGLTLNVPVLWQSERQTSGAPATNEAVTDTWSTPTIVGRYGATGQRGSDGRNGSDGNDGAQGPPGPAGVFGASFTFWDNTNASRTQDQMYAALRAYEGRNIVKTGDVYWLTKTGRVFIWNNPDRTSSSRGSGTFSELTASTAGFITLGAFIASEPDGAGQGRVTLDVNGLEIRDSSNVTRVKIGKL